VDGDGGLDLYLPLPDRNAELFLNDGTGHFTDQAAQFGVTNAGSVGRAAVFADYDNDGDPDLYVVNEGPNRLYRNEGGTAGFTDVTQAAGVGDAGFGTSASWGDYDNDGFVDLYVVNYADCAWNYQADKLYHNQGDRTFTDQTALIEGDPADPKDGNTFGSGFEAAFFDYDRDGDQDIYLANDFNFLGPNPDVNHLWRNDGPDPLTHEWRFTDVTAESGAAPPDLQSMGIAIGDPDGDVDLDLAISDIAGNRALRNNGNGTFTERSDAANIDRPFEHAGVYAITWGLGYEDFNLDGWEDLYVGSGSILVPGEGSQDPRVNQLFVNLKAGDGRFADLSILSGADSALHSRGVAFADYDRDGRMDMYVVNFDGSPVLYRNTTPTTGRHWIEVDPVGTVSNRDGCGALVIVTIGNRRMIREAFCGSVSLGSGNDPYVHFGLGTASRIDRMVIKWPSGTTQVQLNVSVDRTLIVTEPSS